MNILIENAESREYLTQDGAWTKNAGDGKDFGATQAAFEAANRQPIGKFNIVCYFLQKQHSIIITMDQGKGQGTGTCLGWEPSLATQASPRSQRQLAGARAC
jgi:hypothetical protein